MQTRLRAWHETRGGRFDGERLLDHGDPRREYEALRAGAGLWDRSDWVVWRLTGEGRLGFLHKVCTQEVRIEPGRGAYGCVLTVKGGMKGDLWVFARAEDALVVTSPAAAAQLAPYLARYALFDPVKILTAETDPAGPLTLLSVWGPRAVEVVAAATGSAELPTDALAHRACTIAGAEVLVARDDLADAPGLDLILPLADAPAALAALVEVGAIPVGEQAVEQVRIEAGVPLYGADMDESTIPVEAGLGERAISYSKGCYVGQEVIVRIAHRGKVNRVLTGFHVAGDAAPALPAPVFAGEKEVSRITSLARSPRLGGAWIGLGLLHRKHIEGGSELRVGAPDGPRVETRSLPFPAE